MSFISLQASSACPNGNAEVPVLVRGALLFENGTPTAAIAIELPRPGSHLLRIETPVIDSRYDGQQQSDPSNVVASEVEETRELR